MFGLDVGLSYAVLSALLLGVYLFCIKRYFEDYPATVYVGLTYGFSLLWYLPVAAVSLDGNALPPGFGLAETALLVGALAGSVIAVLTSFRSVAVGDVSYVAPIGKLVPVFVLPIELLALGAQLSPVQVGGVVVATAAVYVANYEPGKLFAPLVRAARSHAARLALASAAAFGAVDVGKRVLMQEVGMAPAAFNVALFVTIPVALAPLALRRVPDGIRADLPKFAAVGLLLAAGEHLVMLSFADLPASLASPVINTQAVVAVVLGGVLLGEEALRIRLVAAAFAVAGVTLITLG